MYMRAYEEAKGQREIELMCLYEISKFVVRHLVPGHVHQISATGGCFAELTPGLDHRVIPYLGNFIGQSSE